jgi:hypothetical protein
MSSASASSAAAAEVDEHGEPIVPPWLRHYNRVISRKPQIPAAVGPTACSVCCTFFSLFGALFLFSVASMMRSNYRYIHIKPPVGSGLDLPGLSTSVSYAALLYLILGLVSLSYWTKGNAAKRDAELAAALH